MNAVLGFASTLAIEFRAPARLWLLLGVVALAVVYLVQQRRRKAYAVRFTNLELLDKVAPKRPAWRRHVPALLALLCLSASIAAFAKPARTHKVPRERATIIMAIDTSLSMEADDVAPTRFAAAKQAALDFLDLLPGRLNVGLVSFNGTASVRVSPTTDRNELKSAVRRLQLGERTAIGEAIYASLDAVKAAPPGPKGEKVPARVVLMSDGETTVGRPDSEAAAAAAEQKVPVSTIAFGTDNGTIQLPGEDLPTPVRVNAEALRDIAETTDGTAFTATTGDQLKKVYQDIGSSVGYVRTFQDVTSWFIGTAVVLLFAGMACSLVWFNRLP